jgi:hypothetical protein
VEEPTLSSPTSPASPTTSHPIPAPTLARTTSAEDGASLRIREARDAALADTSDEVPKSPSSPGNGKVKNWLKTKFARRASKGSKSAPGKGKEESGFVGGTALTGATAASASNENENESSALTGATTHDTVPVSPATPTAVVERHTEEDDDVSSLSGGEGEEGEEEFQEARDNFDEDLIPAPTFPVSAAKKSGEEARDSKFKEFI